MLNFFGKSFKQRLWLLACSIAVCGLVACGSQGGNKPLESVTTPVFLLMQAAPDGKSLGALVPSDLLAQRGSLDKVVKSLSPSNQFDLVQFGKTIATFQSTAVNSSDALGAIAIFKVQPDPKDNGKGIAASVLKQPGLVVIPSELNSKAKSLNQDNRSYQFACPPRIQFLVLEKAGSLFLNFGVSKSSLGQVAIASTVCLDIDKDDQPEIVAGLRLDNSLRPEGINRQAWSAFLARSAVERQEYSMLVLLRQIKGEWVAESLITHTRALSYINDSVSSYVLFGAQDLNGDGRLDLIVQEIGLNTIDAQVLSLNIDGDRWQWRSYYQPERSLNIVQ